PLTENRLNAWRLVHLPTAAIVNVPRVIATPLYHFVIAVWRAKQASWPRDRLGRHYAKAQQIWLFLWAAHPRLTRVGAKFALQKHMVPIVAGLLFWQTKDSAPFWNLSELRASC